MVDPSMPGVAEVKEESAPADVDSEKRLAGEAALGEVSSGMKLGLGTGSTVRFFFDALARALATEELSDIVGVPTSVSTQKRCLELGIPLIDLDRAGELDLAVDGADEVTPQLDLIKGLGGALVREKIVVQAARRFVVVADSGKEVGRLGERSPVPVEVIPFGWTSHLPFFRSLGCEPVPREEQGGGLVSTDNGNHVIDLHFSPRIENPLGLERALKARAGVVETGLFLGMADRVLIGTRSGGVRETPSDRGSKGASAT